MKYDLLKKLNIILENHKKNLYDEFDKSNEFFSYEIINEINLLLSQVKNDSKKYFSLIKQMYELLKIDISEEEKANIEAGSIICDFGFDLTDTQEEFIIKQVGFIEEKLSEIELKNKQSEIIKNNYENNINNVKSIQNVLDNQDINTSQDLIKLKDFLIESDITFKELSEGIKEDVLKKTNSI